MTGARRTPAADLTRRRHRWLALAGISVALLAVGLDATVLSLALPTLANALGASESELQWFVTAYTLALTAAMLPAGLVGDRYGRRAVLLGALVLFGAASVGCALAPTPLALIASRTVLGVAGASLIVMALSVITVLFDEAERPRAIGVWGAANFLAMPVGPILGGWLLANAWWGWVFLLNVPVVVAGIVAVALLVPESRASRRPAIDWLGVIGSSAGLTLVMYGVIEAGDHGWTDPGAIGPMLAGAGVLVSFALWEAAVVRRGGQPLVDLGLFRSGAFTWGVILAGIGIFGLFGVLFVLPQYWQGVIGLDAQAAGFRLLPIIGGMVVGALPADRIAGRFGPRITVAAGLAAMTVALAVGSTHIADGGVATLAAWTFLAGLGAGTGLATAASAAMLELDADRSGVGSALVQAVIKLGPAFGATILGSVLSGSYQRLVPVAGLPAGVATQVQSSVFAGLAVAAQLGSASLAAGVSTAFETAMGESLRVAAMATAVAVPLALVFLPARSRTPRSEASQSDHERAVASS
jgi:DHA2 family multidrug resistance protein-like MFS transporter